MPARSSAGPPWRSTRRRALHPHEHDERRPDALGLRDRHRRAWSACTRWPWPPGKPRALVDWNNNYGDDPDKGVVFHCSNLPKDVFVQQSIRPRTSVMDYQAIIAGTVGKDNTYGTVVGRVKAEPVHLLPRVHRRFPRHDPGLPGRGRVHQRPARDLRRLRRGEDPGAAGLLRTSARTASSTTSPSTCPSRPARSTRR